MYRIVTMGSENLVSVIPLIKDKFLLSNVTNQIEEYASYTRETEKQLRKRSIDPKEPKLIKKLMSRGGIAMNTMFDSSDSHIAEMIEKGTRMGLDSLVKKREEMSAVGCDSDALHLCGAIEDFERRATFSSISEKNPHRTANRSISESAATAITGKKSTEANRFFGQCTATSEYATAL